MAPGANARGLTARFALGLLAAATAMLTLATSGTAASEASVQIVYRVYRPADLTVLAGQTVTWHDSSLTPHTVTALGGAFDSGRIEVGGSFSYTFSTPGTFAYMCTIHPTMKGTVVVLAAGASLPPGASQRVLVSVSRRRGSGGGPRGGETIVRVRASTPGGIVLLQSKASQSSPWRTERRARLSATGTVTFALGASVHGRLRAIVRPANGGSQLLSSAVAARV
ncbi:MAG TPA: cupredoxin family copper-binding protein [Solirubrobacteraceae bacterium]|nr:cupredoxin family copper-binding protein [Solirubrobacteraceae bacterium]